MTVIGLIAPGAMGARVAACAADAEVRWVGAGRSPATRRRAEAGGLVEVATTAELIDGADAVLSICPPDRALDVATEVAALGFEGRYVDANAIAPDTARSVCATVAPATFIDGGIIGPPPVEAGTTRLYLSGDGAEEVAAWFASSALDARVLARGGVSASALKMTFAAWTKGSSALLLSVLALARAEGVADDLAAEWAISLPDLADRAERTARGSTPKAWRFTGEMAEIAATFAANDLPDGFHLAAAEAYARLSGFKDTDAPTLDEVLAALLDAS